MKALVLHEVNGPLVLEDRPIPEPGPGEVLVKVLACAPDAFDGKIREGRVAGTRLPVILSTRPRLVCRFGETKSTHSL